MLPLELVYEILGYVGGENDLRRWKCVAKQFTAHVRVHPWTMPPCARCGSHRYRVGPRHMCFVRGCMSSSIIHPIAKYTTLDEKPVCSFTCLVSQAF